MSKNKIKRKVWTKEEVSLLESNSNETEGNLVKLFPDRTLKSIKHKITNSGFYREKTFKRYSSEEDEILKENSTKSQQVLINMLPNRTWESICYRIEALGLERHKSWELWTLEEENIILKYETIEEMAIHLPKRAESKIYSKAIKLGKKFSEKFWSLEEEKTLKELYSEKSCEYISNKLNRTKQSVYLKANRLGLISAFRSFDVESETVIDMYVNEELTIQEIAEIYDVGFSRISSIIPEELKSFRFRIDEKDIVEMYVLGTGTPKIAKKYNTSAVNIATILRENDIEIRGIEYYAEAYRIQLSMAEIIDLYKYGFTSTMIGAMYGVSGATIVNRLNEEGLELRKGSGLFHSRQKILYPYRETAHERSSERGRKGYLKWRTSVLERDEYKCQCCGSAENSLQVHHIMSYAIYEELRTELSNGITLCDLCHDFRNYGSFHHTYGARNNNIFQLQEYFDDIRTHLSLPLITIESIINKPVSTI